jgi:hypothetical protein
MLWKCGRGAGPSALHVDIPLDWALQQPIDVLSHHRRCMLPPKREILVNLAKSGRTLNIFFIQAW